MSLPLLQTASFSTLLPLPHPSKTSFKPLARINLCKPIWQRRLSTTVRAFSSDEFPVGDEDDVFLQNFKPQERESEDEARRRNWIERGWAPWEEILTPEAHFARLSLNEGEEVALQNPESIEAFKMLTPKYRKEKIKQMGLTEDEYYAKQFEIKGEIPEPLNTVWAGPLVLRHVPPRDWPPPDWEVDREELEFIRGAHILQHVTRVDYDKVEEMSSTDTGEMNMDRYKMFLKQYTEWVAANKDRLEEESYKVEFSNLFIFCFFPELFKLFIKFSVIYERLHVCCNSS